MEEDIEQPTNPKELAAAQLKTIVFKIKREIHSTDESPFYLGIGSVSFSSEIISIDFVETADSYKPLSCEATLVFGAEPTTLDFFKDLFYLQKPFEGIIRKYTDQSSTSIHFKGALLTEITIDLSKDETFTIKLLLNSYNTIIN